MTLNEINIKTFTLTIDGLSVKAEEGQIILDVALKNNIYIPTLCHDPRLKGWGSCRMCIVEVKGYPRPMTSCTTIASPGLEVAADNPRLNKLRRGILELILSDHPLDCLVCETSGSCKLQDLAYRYEVKKPPFRGARSIAEEDRCDPFIYSDYDKCIRCGSCIRICKEVEHVSAIEFGGSGFNLHVIPRQGKTRTDAGCELCGQCVSACPTGALTDKPSRGRARLSETTKVETICPYCAVGCGISLHVKNDEVVRVSGNTKSQINHGNLCVKGRYGYEFIGHPERLKTPLIKRDGKLIEATWEDALTLIAGKFTQYKGDEFAAIGSARITNEENYLVQKFTRSVMETNNIDNCARL